MINILMDIELLKSKLHRTTRQIAEDLGTSQTNVRYWLKKYGLRTDSKQGRRDIDYHAIGEKTCSQCHTSKKSQDFYAHTKHGRLHAYCKQCMTENTINRQRAFKQQCVDYKGSKCQICDYDKCVGALEFHHLDPSKKDFSISKVKNHEFSDLIREELDKCALLCANCHREAHAGLIGPFI